MDLCTYYKYFIFRDVIDSQSAPPQTFHEAWLYNHNGLDTCGIGVYPHPSHINIPFHNHDYFELIYVHKGFCLNLIDQQAVRMDEGDICLMNPTAYHTLRCPDPDCTIIFNILIAADVLKSFHFRSLSNNDFIEDFFFQNMERHGKLNSYVLFPHQPGTNTTGLLCQQIIQEHFESKGKLYQRSKLIHLFDCLLVDLIRIYQEENNIPIGIRSPQYRISDVILYLGEHCDTVTLTSAAEHFSYHPKHFSRLLQKATGLSFSELLLSIRMQQAKSMLEDEVLPITSIMHMVGYQNYCAFTNQFKNHFGVFPLDIRKSAQIPK